MSKKTITHDIADWEGWVAAWCAANGDEVDENSEANVLKRMDGVWFEMYERGKREQEKKKAVINRSILSVKE